MSGKEMELLAQQLKNEYYFAYSAKLFRVYQETWWRIVVRIPRSSDHLGEFSKILSLEGTNEAVVVDG